MKRTASLLVLLIFICMLSACSKKTEKAEPLVKFEDFRYNNTIGWDASYDDIVAQYGEPKKTGKTYSSYSMTYYYVPVCGHTMTTLTFYYSYDTDLLESIYLEYKENCYIRSDQVEFFEDISNGLKTKYGEPDYALYDPEYSHVFSHKWRTQVEDTEINNYSEASQVSGNIYRYHRLSYTCKRADELRAQNNKRPDFALGRPSPTFEPTPVSSPTPTPTANNDGV